MDDLRPNAEKYFNPSREYFSRLISTLQNDFNLSTSEISRLIGVNRSGLYNYMRTDDRYRPHSYSLQFTLEELIQNLQVEKSE